MRDDQPPWEGHQRLTLPPLASAGPGAVGFYDRLVAASKKPGSNIATEIAAVDTKPGTPTVRQVLLQSLNNFASVSSSEERMNHLTFFVGMLDRLKAEGAVQQHREAIDAAMNNLTRIIYDQYNAGRTDDPDKTRELLAVAKAAQQDGCLDGPKHEYLLNWIADQTEWEKKYSSGFRAQLAASRSIGHADAEDKSRYKSLLKQNNLKNLAQFLKEMLRKNPTKYKKYIFSAMLRASTSTSQEDYTLFGNLAAIYIHNHPQAGARAQLTEEELNSIKDKINAAQNSGIQSLEGRTQIIDGLKRLRRPEPFQTVKDATTSLEPPATPKITSVWSPRGISQKIKRALGRS
jgi:hypothetical protein